MKLTRRQILKIALAAAAGVLGPKAARGQVKLKPKEGLIEAPKPISPVIPRKAPVIAPKGVKPLAPGKVKPLAPEVAKPEGPPFLTKPSARRLRTVMKRSVKDRRFRRQLLRDPDKVLAKQRLIPTHQDRVLERVKMVNVVGFTLALQAMKNRKSIRPLLLNPDKRQDLLLNPLSPHRAGIPLLDLANVDRIRGLVDNVAVEILQTDPDSFFGGIPGGLAGVSDPGGCINNLCSADTGGCSDDGCYDFWCSDNDCNNTGACIHDHCFHEECTDSTSCSNSQKCKDERNCEDTGSCLIGGAVIDSLIDDLVGRLEETLDRGPALDFMVQVEDTMIPAETFLNPSSLHDALEPYRPPP